VRTRAVVTSILASVGIVVVGWQIGAGSTAGTNVSSLPALTTTPPNTTGDPALVTPGGSPTDSSPSASPSSTPSATPNGSTTASDKKWTGSNVNTPFGSVQVRLTVASGVITDVTAVHLTNAGGRSVQISNYAAPILRQEVLASQSANVSNVGGATYTSQAYLSSVQAALDQAGL
jgi:uncharacterized protein with FMN-binding domain